jgi:hypothetical protein
VRSLCLLACLAACGSDGPPAGVDAADAATSEWVVVEELSIPVSSAAVTSVVELQAGVPYRLRASGTYSAALDTPGDAEYFGFSTGTPTDTLSGVDVGLAVNDTTVDGLRMPRWGAYNDTHVYEVDWVGAAGAITVQLHDATYGNNTGSLTLAILAHR